MRKQKSKMSFKILLLILVSTISVAVYGKVTLKVSGLKVEISNDLVKFNFNKDATISTANFEDEDLVAGADRSFYLDWTGSNGEVRFHPSSVHIVEQTDERAHFYWVQNSSVTSDAFNIELHYILEEKLSGMYIYAKYSNDKNVNVSFAESRMVFRFNPSRFTQGANQIRTGTIPTKSEINKCKKVQDATYEFSNGTYYTKYDYAVYIRETQYQGVYGNGIGAFVISPSRDYHGGGPLKQDLTVHEYSLITNYFVSAHFGCPALDAPPGWTHIYGPFLLHFSTGTDENLLEDANSQAIIEQQRWPYSFINDSEYPQLRGMLSGTVSGQKNATIVLYDSINEEFDRQQLGYLYSTNTDEMGNYMIQHIRPGLYKLVAYPLAGSGSDILIEKTVNITEDAHLDLNLSLSEPENIIWALGEANRRSNEFKLADQLRNYKWEFEPPALINFTVGVSDPKIDWYYAQSTPGTWSILYQDTQDGNTRMLRLALAAAIKSQLTITLNGQDIGNLDLENDSSIYRSAMQGGRYRSNLFEVNPELVVSGENILKLTLISGGVMYDAISLQIGNK